MSTASSAQQIAVGSLVRVRERDWVVLPSDDEEVLRLRPLTGSDAEICGLYRPFERDLQQASFPDPRPETAGDFISGALLRNAARLSLRSGAGPFRSLGRLSVRPRPYQFVPLIMALKLDPVRMLIADDVGIGKTIEALFIARELLDRGDALRFCVLCPPHLCDQWALELESKFHLQPTVVKSSTWARLERDLPPGSRSVFGHYQNLVVSIDFAKREPRRSLFRADCPDLIIVDEAHTAAQPGGAASTEQQQRHELLRDLAADKDRHLVLLTATPHSGIEESFQSLLALLNERFGRLNLQQLEEKDRSSLAKQFIQRRRADVERWLGETRFPKRDSKEETYPLGAEYTGLFEDVLQFTRETIDDPRLSKPRQRVRYWAALSLLRSVMSSPAAGAKAFATREQNLQPSDPETESDEQRAREVLDPLTEAELLDTLPERPIELSLPDFEDRDRRRLREFARRAESLIPGDPKIEKAAHVISALLKKGHKPVVFCRFVATAEYVAQQIEARLKKIFSGIHAIAVTGESGGDEERRALIAELVKSEHRVLVATDCLSEGVNLQEDFDAVLHYDLPWNPNRLEQREGRVDRFGQKTSTVPAVLLYSPDNRMDGIVLRVLIRKAEKIFRTTGVRVPVPVDSETVLKTITEALFTRPEPDQMRLFQEQENEVERIWMLNAEREKASRDRFAQHAIKPGDVAKEIEATDDVLGDPNAVKRFLADAAGRLGFTLQSKQNYYVLDISALDPAIRDRLKWQKPQKVIFDSPAPEGLEDAIVIGRNHPLVVALSEKIMGEAFRENPQPRVAQPPSAVGSLSVEANVVPALERFSRCGAAYTDAVKTRTALLLLRIRYRLATRRKTSELFAEELVTAGFAREDGKTVWRTANEKELLNLVEGVVPKGQISPQERQQQVAWALDQLKNAQLAQAGDELARIAAERAAILEDAHARLREQLDQKARLAVTPYPPDVLGIYVLVPGGGR
jgi:superfamily II DNA or RNA helicase